MGFTAYIDLASNILTPVSGDGAGRDIIGMNFRRTNFRPEKDARTEVFRHCAGDDAVMTIQNTDRYARLLISSKSTVLHIDMVGPGAKKESASSVILGNAFTKYCRGTTGTGMDPIPCIVDKRADFNLHPAAHLKGKSLSWKGAFLHFFDPAIGTVDEIKSRTSAGPDPFFLIPAVSIELQFLYGGILNVRAEN
jgi:hypothetical protein